MWLGPDFRLKSPRLRTPEHPNRPKNSLNAVFAAHIVTWESPHLLVIIGYIVVCASVFGGFALAGGHLAALFQPIELLMIGGAALGAFLVGNNNKAIKATLAALPSLFKGSRYTQELYMELMSLLFEVLSKVRKEGLMSIEGDIDKPEESPLF